MLKDAQPMMTRQQSTTEMVATPANSKGEPDFSPNKKKGRRKKTPSKKSQSK
jgi:hypothetical protein